MVYQYRHPTDPGILVYQPYGPDSPIRVRPTAVTAGRSINHWRASVLMPGREYWWKAANLAHAQRLCERIANLLADVPESEAWTYLQRLELD